MFFKQVKHWFVARASSARWRPIHDWAESRNAHFRIAKDGRGFLIEQPKALPGSLRIEWGPSQRAYIEGNELRMRCELRLHGDLQMMVLCRTLMDQLESAVFEAYTDTLKTRVDTDTPEEMRWLVMFPKFTQISSKLVRQRFGAVGVNKELVAAWLEGDLSEVLAQASQDLLPEGQPFVLMTMRGNAYLRTAMAVPSLQSIQGLVKVLELACRELQKVNEKLTDRGPWPTTTSIAWQSSRPDEDPAQA
ncbi:hypothetical protein [Roseateles oligotrophus]|uniref:Recombination-associated protein RdgC n=1 Tax=Roseateles oligotrophus TaxID=1769250 RepID=A0ABT2YF70_9BURK|nr:hypothetical protein [Roseateles oligotrophus]MCV2368699.1 hypothetical protein [Roseateles oligotrophus]